MRLRNYLQAALYRRHPLLPGRQDILYGRTAQAPFTLWNTIANPQFDPTPLHHHTSFLDGNASLQYALNRDLMAYVSYGHGSKAGGYVETNTVAVPPDELVDGKVPAALVAQTTALKDEIAQSYEGGMKTLLFQRAVRLNVAGFLTTIQNFQDSVFTGGSLGFITFNDPVRSVGAEADAAWNLGHGLQLDGGMTYADATALIQPIDPVTNAPQVNASGQPVIGRYQHSQAPKIIYNLNADYRHPVSDRLEVHLNAGLRHRSGMFNQRQDQFYSPQLTTLDLGAGLSQRSGRWSVDIVARNVTDAISQDFASAPPDPRFGAFYGPPDEVETVRPLYRMFVLQRRTESELAALLNREGVKSYTGAPWTRGAVHQILTNEKYIGNNVFNRVSNKLKAKRVVNSADMWVRAEGAFEGIVESDFFEAAQRIMYDRTKRFTDDEVLAVWSG